MPQPKREIPLEERVTVALPKPLYAELTRRAFAEERSVAGVVRHILKQVIAEQEQNEACK